MKKAFENLVDSGELDAPIFSFYLADDDSGVLTLGGVDESHHTGDDVTWLSLATPFYGFWYVIFFSKTKFTCLLALYFFAPLISLLSGKSTFITYGLGAT